MTGTIALALSKLFTKETADEMGAVKGAPCEIKSIVKENGRNTTTFLWKDKNNVTHESTMIVLDGTPIYVWTSGDSYTYGDLVIYASAFYRCITPNSDVEFDGTKWNEIGSPDGNYDIVENSDLLPAIFTAADRKLYYSIEDGFFWLWNGEEWEAQVDDEPVEDGTGYVSSGALYAVKEALESGQNALTSVVNTNVAKIQVLESWQRVLTSVTNTHTNEISALQRSTVELTAQEYNNLSPEQKMNGTVYYIKDGSSGSVGMDALTRIAILEASVNTLLTDSLRFKRKLLATDNLNEITVTGIYNYQGGDSKPSNAPSTDHNCVVLMYDSPGSSAADSNFIQEVIEINVAPVNIYMRNYDINASSWSEWRRLYHY